MMHSENALRDTLVAVIRSDKMLLMNLYHKLMRLYSIALIHDMHDLSLVPVCVKPATIKRRGSAVPIHESKKIFIQSARLSIDRLWKIEFPVNRRYVVSNRPPMERLRNATSTASISPASSFARTTPNPNMREAVRAYPVPRRCNGLLQFR